MKTRQISKHTKCIGVFLCFTAKRLMWVTKEAGQSWTGDYFRDNVLSKEVIPFLKDRRNVLSVKETTFLHDRAPCMKALATQALLRANKIDFFGNDEWPGASPDLNPCEHLGSVLKKRVEENIQSQHQPLEIALDEELKRLEYDTELFSALLRSFPARLRAVVEAGGGNTKY